MTNFNKNYTTYFYGDPNDIRNSSKIRLFYNESVYPSLSNLLEIQEKIMNVPGYNKSGIDEVYTRESSEDYYKIDIDWDKSDTKVFNTIIYYSKNSDLPIGFTYFSRLQNFSIDENSKIEILRIYTDFSIKILDTPEEITIINSLSSLSFPTASNSNLAEEPLKIEEAYGYPSISRVQSYFSETMNSGLNYIRYTNSLIDLINDPSYVLLTDCLVLSGGETLNKYKTALSNGVEVNSYDVTYTNFFVGNYNGNLALYEWSSEKETYGTYRVLSLMEKTRFNLPRVLVEKARVPGIDENYQIITMSGKHLILRNIKSEKSYILDLSKESNELVEIPDKYRAVADSWGFKDKVYYFKDDFQVNSILDIFEEDSELYKEIISLPIDPELYSSLLLINKVGPWFIFRNTKTTDFVTLIYASVYGTIYFHESEESEIIPINSRTILLQTKLSDDSGYEFSFYFTRENGFPVYSDVYSEKSREAISKDVVNKIKFSSKILDDSPLLIKQRKVIIDGLRRAPIESYSFPLNRKFISAFNGILFYIEGEGKDQKIYYL